MGEETVEYILKFMNDGTNKIKPSPSKNIILVLGDSGTGKSTLTRLLSTNDDYLVAEKAGGSGYTIVDPSKAICTSTFVSCTVIPELVIDQENNQTYYDCPGFRDTRSVTHDISTSYFIRKVIDEAESIKIIFTLSYNSVRKGGSRHDFSKLVENVFSMFKDIRKYEESVCLVVNKVENVYEIEDDGRLKIVPDDIMLQDVIEFLKESKNPQVNSLLSERTTQLINIFINDKDPKSPRIGIFRRPIKAGPLSKMKEFQNGRSALQKMIYDQLKYTQRDVNDFGYTIEQNSKLRLRDIEDEINKTLLDDVSIIGQQLIEYFKEKEKESNDIDGLVKEFIGRLEKSKNLKRALSEGTVNARLFVQEVIIFLDELNYTIPEEKRSKLSTYCDYLEFIETMIKTTQHQPDQWQNSLREFWRYLDESLNWYSFLIDLRVTLSEYSIQSDVESFTSLIDEFRSISELDREDVIGFLEELLPKINEKTGRRHEIPNIDEIGTTKVKFLLALMDVGFTPMSTECHEQKLEVKGFNIRMADIVNVMEQCDKPEVEVFALSKIFVDADFIKKEAQLSMIAPELEVISNQQIILDGADGAEHESAVTSDTSPGSDGSDGRPGLPGTSAGVLVTAVYNCGNCNRLTVSATGGRGGPGQDGGDGVQGSDGEEAEMMTYSANKNVWIDNWRSAGFSPNCYTEGSRKRRGIFIPILAFLAGAVATGAIASRASTPAVTNVSKRVKCYVNGLFGKPGGKGGNGGVGGEGGNEGRVSFLNAKSTPTNEGPKITVKKGLDGASGAGGNGGLGGLQGDTLTQELTENSLYPNIIGSTFFSESNYRAENGISGAGNMNADGLIHPKSMNHTLDLPNVINSYKNYLQLNSENAVMNSTWENFLEFFEIHGKTRRSLPEPSPTPVNEESGSFSSKTNHTDPIRDKLNSTADAASNNVIGLIAGNATAGHPVDFNVMNVQSNLLLMDVIIRKVKGRNENATKNMWMDEPKDGHAHFLAYNAHIPENVTIPK